MVRSSKTKRAAHTITKFLKNVDIVKQKTKFLNAICSDSGQCIAFGLETKKIKAFFHNFNFDYADADQIKKIGKPSSNGFVTEIPYTREGYTSYAVLKSSSLPNSDNLYYEAFVGRFINKKNLQYPCFLETYGVYKTTPTVYYKLYNLSEHVKITQNEMQQIKQFKYGMDTYSNFLDPSDVNMSCKESMNFSVLVQHIKNAMSISDHRSLYKQDISFMSLHLVNYLFQVYCPLANLSNEFTHYDLHGNNVLIYNPSNTEDKYVTMVYHYDKNDTDVVSFHTFGIAKIIDYGRCYFNDTSVSPPVSSMDMYNVVSDANKTPNCIPNGEKRGYRYLGKKGKAFEYYALSAQQRNKSHDLRLARNMYAYKDTINNEKTASIIKILNVVHKNYYSGYLKSKNRQGEDEKIGMEEDVRRYYAKEGDSIWNVEDMHTALKNLIQKTPYFKEDNDAFFQDREKLGTLHIYLYDNKPMEYIPE